MTPTRLLGQGSARRRLCALGLLVPAAIGFSAAQAWADGETITMTQTDPTAIVGHATNFNASGTLNPDDTMFGFSLYIFMKDADLDPTCAADEDAEAATAMGSGGNESWVSPGGPGFQIGTGPTYSQPFKVTFGGTGHYLLCGYVNSDFSTMVSGSLRGTVVSDTPPTPTAKRPAVVRMPWVTRKGHVLTCHAGTWSHKPTHRSYRWYVKGHARSVGSGQRLKVRKSLRGHKLVCRVTASNAAGARTVTTRWVRGR